MKYIKPTFSVAILLGMFTYIIRVVIVLLSDFLLILLMPLSSYGNYFIIVTLPGHPKMIVKIALFYEEKLASDR